MVFAEILAGGMGTRMGDNEKPKQFLMIGKKPIIIYTIEQFIKHPKIDIIVICCPKDWLQYMKELLDEYLPNSNVKLVEGGATRYDSLINGCKYIEKNYDLTDQDIIMTHDSVRPLVSQRIIFDSIEGLKEYDGVTAGIPAIDTIFESITGDEILSIPNRSHLYQGQTPGSFYIKTLISLYEALKEEEKKLITDTEKLYAINNKKLKLIKGDRYNFKITNKCDLKIANALLDEFEEQNQ